MSKQEKHQCRGRCENGMWSSTQCNYNASVERDGKWYCKTHDPVRVAERNERRYAEMDKKRDLAFEQMEVKKKAKAYDALCRKACDGFDDPMKMQAEHAEMLAMLDDAAHALTCTDMILQRDVAQDAKALVAKIEKRKAQ